MRERIETAAPAARLWQERWSHAPAGGGLRRERRPAGEVPRLAELLSDPQGGPRLLDLWAQRTEAETTLNALTANRERVLLHSFSLGGTTRYPALAWLVPAAHPLEEELARSKVVPEAAPWLEGQPEPTARPRERGGVSGRGVFTIPFGPIRSGVVESIRFDVGTAGEDMLKVEVRGGFKHRGLERRLTEVPLDQAPLVAERLAGVHSVAGAIAVSQAVEAAAQVQVGRNALAVRAALAETERLHNHCDAILKLAEDASLQVAVAQMGMLKERILRLLARLTGHRYGRGVVTLGGVARGIDSRALASELRAWRKDAERVFHLLLATDSFLDRLQRTGRLSPEDAAALGACGPLARGSRLSWDARAERPYGLYAALDVAPRVMSDCDAMARFEVRLAEVGASCELIEAALASGELESPGAPARVEPEAGALGFGCAEAAEGEWTVVVEAASSRRLSACRVRPASIPNFACLPRACEGWVLTDFSFIEHSFGLSVAGRDG